VFVFVIGKAQLNRNRTDSHMLEFTYSRYRAARIAN